MENAFSDVRDRFGKLDGLVHAIAFSDKEELKGSFTANTTRANFLRTMDISAFSFVDAARRAAALMPGRRRDGDADLSGVRAHGTEL